MLLFRTFLSVLIITEAVKSQDTCEPTTTIINQYYGEAAQDINANQEPAISATGPQGRPGKQGPAGLKGSKGDEGECQCTELQNQLDRLKTALEADECSSSPCQHEGTCVDQLNSYKCECVPGSYGTNCELVATSCEEIQTLYMGKDDGVFLLKPLPDEDPLLMYCDQSVDGGNWMVFQRRYNGQQDFYLNFRDYENGFGSKSGEFWLGLKNLHKLTTSMDCEMRVDLEDFSGGKRFALYSSFSIGPGPGYTLSISGYKGNAGDSLVGHNNHKFSTKDKDQDASSTESCSRSYKGGWWYYRCHDSNLNARYGYGINDNTGNRWKAFRGANSLKASKMMIRKKVT